MAKMTAAADVNDYFDKMLAKQAADNAKVKVTKAEIEREAKFLLGWAKAKEVRHNGGVGSTMYASGKWMTKLVPNMVKGLLAAGYAVGTERSFKMNKAAIKALEE
jgi:hypothetical protein